MSEASTKTIDDGGSAFGFANYGCTSTPEGMIQPEGFGAPGNLSLRDWFAGQALTGIITRQVQVETRGREEGVEDFHKRCNETLRAVANRNIVVAFQYADAMLAARKAVQS